MTPRAAGDGGMLTYEQRRGLKCPNCGSSADRPKCMWDMGAYCPRLYAESYEQEHPMNTEAQEQAVTADERDAAIRVLTRVVRLGVPDAYETNEILAAGQTMMRAFVQEQARAERSEQERDAAYGQCSNCGGMAGTDPNCATCFAVIVAAMRDSEPRPASRCGLTIRLDGRLRSATTS